MKYAIAAVAVVAAIAGGAIAQTSTAPSASSPAATTPAAPTTPPPPSSCPQYPPAPVLAEARAVRDGWRAKERRLAKKALKTALSDRS